MTVQKVLSFDLGGTKIAAGVVTSQGKVLEEVKMPAKIDQGKKALFGQLTEIGKYFLDKYPSIQRVGMASAGPVDPESGVLLDPTNFSSGEGSWGKVPIAKVLSQKLDRPVVLENDAAAAILAEHWRGAAKNYDNAMILTLGTGLGTGVLANGKLVRAGRNLHTEAGHLILRSGDTSAPCGCGNLGCAEAYLSGKNFALRARSRFADPALTGKDIAELARAKDPRALAAFEEYAELMAVAIHNYTVIYAPEIVIFTGSFAETADLFLPSTRRHLETFLARRRIGIDFLPKLKVSTLKNRAGLIGGAWVALHPKKHCSVCQNGKRIPIAKSSWLNSARTAKRS